jgi:hypothetical protein
MTTMTKKTRKAKKPRTRTDKINFSDETLRALPA